MSALSNGEQYCGINPQKEEDMDKQGYGKAWEFNCMHTKVAFPVIYVSREHVRRAIKYLDLELIEIQIWR